MRPYLSPAFMDGAGALATSASIDPRLPSAVRHCWYTADMSAAAASGGGGGLAPLPRLATQSSSARSMSNRICVWIDEIRQQHRE